MIIMLKCKLDRQERASAKNAVVIISPDFAYILSLSETTKYTIVYME